MPIMTLFCYCDSESSIMVTPVNLMVNLGFCYYDVCSMMKLTLLLVFWFHKYSHYFLSLSVNLAGIFKVIPIEKYTCLYAHLKFDHIHNLPDVVQNFYL